MADGLTLFQESQSDTQLGDRVNYIVTTASFISTGLTSNLKNVVDCSPSKLWFQVRENLDEF